MSLATGRFRPVLTGRHNAKFGGVNIRFHRHLSVADDKLARPVSLQLRSYTID